MLRSWLIEVGSDAELVLEEVLYRDFFRVKGMQKKPITFWVVECSG